MLKFSLWTGNFQLLYQPLHQQNGSDVEDLELPAKQE